MTFSKWLQQCVHDEDPPADYVPTAEEVAALVLYAKRHGARWKEDLWVDWYHGRMGLPDPHGPALRRVRNRGGPRWLASISIDPGGRVQGIPPRASR